MVLDTLSRLFGEITETTEVEGILNKSIYYVTLVSISDNFKSRFIKAYSRDD